MTIGKTSDGEVDFVAQKQNDRLYVQVTQEIKSEKTEKREYERLLEIRDNYPKYDICFTQTKKRHYCLYLQFAVPMQQEKAMYCTQ